MKGTVLKSKQKHVKAFRAINSCNTPSIADDRQASAGAASAQPTSLCPGRSPPARAHTHSGSRSPRSGSSRGCSVSTARPWPHSGWSAGTGHRGRRINGRRETPDVSVHDC